MFLQRSSNTINSFRPPDPTSDPTHAPPALETLNEPKTTGGSSSSAAPPENDRSVAFSERDAGKSTQQTPLPQRGIAAEGQDTKVVVEPIAGQPSPTSKKGARKVFPKNEDYDPYKYRIVENPTSNGETLIHLLKSSLGTGILAMPHAISLTGYLIGAILTCCIGAMGVYCLHILLRSQYAICKRMRIPLVSYPQTMLYALKNGPSWLTWLAPASPYIVEGFLIFYQIGICACYVVFVATTMKQICDYYLENTLDVRLHMLFIVFPLILLNCVRNLKLLAPFSTLANLITFVGLGIILSYIFTDMPSISERDMAGQLKDYAMFFGIVLFALEAVGVIIALESNMRNPADFRGTFGILNIGLGIIVILYVVIGVLGYMKYGPECRGSITLNLPENEKLAQAVKITMALAVFISYALQCYVPVTVIWNDYMLGKLIAHNVQPKKREYWNYGLRVVIVIITFIMGALVPRLGVFISLVGALSLSALGLVFPATIEMCVYWHDEWGCCNWRVAKDCAIIAFGLLGLVLGTYAAIVDMFAE